MAEMRAVKLVVSMDLMKASRKAGRLAWLAEMRVAWRVAWMDALMAEK